MVEWFSSDLNCCFHPRIVICDIYAYLEVRINPFYLKYYLMFLIVGMGRWKSTFHMNNISSGDCEQT